MKIAFNPSTVAALTTPPNNKDITFDLRGRNIFARGVEFKGTDTNTWRDIKINNVSIGSHTLDLRNGSNTTLTNTNGVVTINSTWRPVVDNLTSDSTTSSLSAKQGKVLKALIDGKSNSDHNHDGRYLKLTGGTMASNALITFADSGSWDTSKKPQGARGGLYWTGQSDYAKLYAEETVGDNLDLVIQFGDDNSNGLSIRNKANTQTSYISSSGVITTGTFKGNLDWSYITNKPATATRWPSWAEVTGKPSSFTPSTHTHGLSNSVFFLNMPSINGNAKWKEVFGYPVNYNLLLSVRINSPAPEWCVGNFGSGILYGGSDTKGFMSSAYNEPFIMWAGGNGSSDDSVPRWYIGIKGTHKSIYNLATIASEANAAYNLRHSHANKSVLDGITSALVNSWNTAYNFVSNITGTDTDKVINKWEEIVNFLAGITEDNKLNTLLNSKLSVYELADNTNVGTIKNNGIYYSTTDASSGTLINSPFNTGFAFINMTSYDGGDDLRRSRLAFNAFGEIKVSDDRDQANTAETWYNVLTSKNSGINGSTIKLNGTSITVYSSGTADGRYVKKSGDTMQGVLTIDTTNFGALTIKRNDDVNGASIQFRGKSSVYGYIGLNNSTKDKQFLRWNSDISRIYTILDTSSTYISNGKGVINGTTITQVDNATNSTNSTNARKLVNWYSARPTSLNAQFGDGSLRIFYATSSTTEGKPAEDSHILHLAWDNTGGWDAQLAVHARSGKVSTRAQNGGTWQPWKTLAFITDIPTSLKNPYSFNVFGVVYDGSAAKTVTTSNFISQVSEGTSTVTDGTMLITSYASNSGFADTNAVNVPYKRKAIHLWEYIKTKTDSLYATRGHNHDGRYAISENYGGFKKSGRLPISGFYQSNESESGGNAPWSNWMHLINCQHTNTNNNFALQIAASFFDNNTFKIRVTNNNVNNSWRNIIHSGNISSQSVNYANSAGNADTVDGEHASAFTRKVGRYSINTNGTAPYNYIYLFRIANSNTNSTLDCEIDFRSRYHSAKLEIRIAVGSQLYGAGSSVISIVKKVINGRSCNFWVLPTVQSSGYNYYDIYYQSEGWDFGSYDIILRDGCNSKLVFEHKGTKLDALPPNVSVVNNQWVMWNDIAGKPSSFTPAEHNHDGRYVRAFGTSNDNINSDWGQSFKTFDPIPLGTPPEKNPNISLLSIGENFSRRKQLAFIWNNDNIYYRRHTDSGFTNWRRLAFANEIPTSLPANGGNADTVDNEHASNFSYTHQTSFDFSKGKSGRIVTFDQSNTDYGWINGFASTHNDYLTSVIFNTHRTSNWYVGYIEAHSGITDGLRAVKQLAFLDSKVADSDKLDGVHLNGIFTGFSYAQSRLTATIGTVSKTVNVTGSYPSIGGVTMNTIASYGNCMGMANLASSNSNVNPNNQTSWHHFINMSYNTESTNMWQTQFAIKAGTTEVWVRSRAGGSISDSSAWAAPWVRLARITDNIASATNADMVDGYHENSFLRYRGATYTDQEVTLWSQIGIKQYNNALPDNLTGVYSYGSVISLPGFNSRFEIYASHQSSNGNGLYYRSGWDNDKKAWLKFIDSSNIGSQSVNYANSAGHANSAGNADTLGGIPRNYGQAPFGTIPSIGNDGVMEIGRYIDFHSDNSGSYDYSTRIQATGNYKNTVNLPSASGTLALTSYGGDDSTPIFLGCLDLYRGDDGTISSSFYCLGYSVPFTYTRGGNYCKIVIPDTTRLSFYIIAAIASVNYSGGGMDTWVGEHRGDGAWWLHCQAFGWNEVRVKGFRLANGNNDSWWGGNPLYSGNGGANKITVCIFGHVKYK